MNSAYNFPCMFDKFGHIRDPKKNPINYPEVIKRLTKIQEDSQTKMIIGGQFHEIFKICLKLNLDPFEYLEGYLNIMVSDTIEIQLTVLPNLSTSINLLNEYFRF